MPNKVPTWALWGIAAVAGYVVWTRMRNPLGIAPPVTGAPLPATPQGTNSVTDSSVPGHSPAADAAGVLDQDPTAPVWIPVAAEPEGGYWKLAGDLASDLVRFDLYGTPMEAPQPMRQLVAGDQPRRDEFVTAHDASISPAMAWEEAAAREVAIGLGAGVAA